MGGFFPMYLLALKNTITSTVLHTCDLVKTENKFKEIKEI